MFVRISKLYKITSPACICSFHAENTSILSDQPEIYISLTPPEKPIALQAENTEAE